MGTETKQPRQDHTATGNTETVSASAGLPEEGKTQPDGESIVGNATATKLRRDLKGGGGETSNDR